MVKRQTFVALLPLLVMGCKPKELQVHESLSTNGSTSNQVTVHVVYTLNEALDRSLRKQGIKICVGQISWADKKDTFNKVNQDNNNFIGVWLGTLGCYTGNGYKLSGTGVSGENVVTPLWWRSRGILMGIRDGISQRDLGTLSFDLLGASPSRGKLNELCSGKYATYCRVGIKKNTLAIEPL